jgi:hypothetical protein
LELLPTECTKDPLSEKKGVFMQIIEKRNKYVPVPKNLNDYLSEDQKLALKNLRQFGTDVQFVRRPVFAEPTVVLMTADGNTLGFLDNDGNVNTGPRLVLRAT